MTKRFARDRAGVLVVERVPRSAPHHARAVHAAEKERIVREVGYGRSRCSGSCRHRPTRRGPPAGGAAARGVAGRGRATAAGLPAGRDQSARSAPLVSSRGSARPRPSSTPRELRLERRERFELEIREPVAVDVFDTGFGLAFGAGPVRRRRARLHVPIATERQVGRMKDDVRSRGRARSPTRRIVAEDGANTVARHCAPLRFRRRTPTSSRQAPSHSRPSPTQWSARAPGIEDKRAIYQCINDLTGGGAQRAMRRLDKLLISCDLLAREWERDSR